MPELKGIGYLRNKLNLYRSRILTRYKFYEMKNYTFDFGISTPPDLKSWMGCLGWCSKSVDTLANRLKFYDFADDNFDLKGIYDMNNPDVLFDSAILSALICSCSFIHISDDADGFPRLEVIDGCNATGILDQYTGMLTEGYAVLERDEHGDPLREAYFIPGQTTYYTKGKLVDTRNYDAPYALLVPIIFRPDAHRPFGHSRISRACMSIQGSAIRTIKRSEISSEFYSYPQRYLLGVDDGAEVDDSWKASISKFFTATKNNDGTNPVMGQFTQESMQPFSDQLRMFASLFAGETGLTLDDMGFATENPSSADAIKATHENLKLTAQDAQKKFGSGFINAGYLAACVRDKFAYQRKQIYLTKMEWEPIFTPDASMLSLIGDGTIKINQAIPGYIDSHAMRILTGIDSGGDTNNG